MKNLKNLWYSEFSVVLLAILASGILGLIFGFLFEFLFFGCLLLVFVYFLQFGLIVYDASTEVGLDRKLFYLTPFARRWFTIVRNNRSLVNRLELSVARYKGRVAKRKLRMATAVRGFRDSLSVMSDAIVLVDRQNRIDWWNPAASELLGLSRSIDRNKPLKSLFNGEEFEKFVSNYEDDDSIELRSPTSEDALLSLRLTPYGRDRLILQARDVTRIKHLEQVRRDFVANASHELRTPLTVVHGYLETMMDNPESVKDNLSDVLGQMHLQTVRIKVLVEDMLTLSRLDQSFSHDVQIVSMESLLKEVLVEAKILSGVKQHNFILDTVSGYKIHANSEDLRSLVTNLVSNAIRYTPAEGTIDLMWWIDDTGAYFAVRDNGIGIEAEHLSRITERFYRANVAESRASGGTGLGLAIVKNVMETLGGELSITSKPASGSTFTCFFPLSCIEHETTQLEILPD